MRITGGRLRGRRLPHPVPRGARPSSARVREALFSILGQNLDGLRVLDAFGGSGILALETASRGADVVCVERDRRSAELIRSAADALGAAVQVVTGSSPQAAPKEPFDLVLADPPYAADLQQILPGLASRVGGRMVLEHARRVEAPNLPGLEMTRSRRYGDTLLSFYRPSEGSGR